MRALLAAITAFCAAVSPAAAQTILLDAEIEAVLEEYTDPLLRAANIRPEDVHLYLVGDDSINAFVTGGQNIFIHTGLILRAENPNQVKGVLAHEIGHISGGHLVRGRGAQTAAIGTMLLAMGVGILAAAAGAGDAGAAVIAGSQQMGYASLANYTLAQEAATDQAGASYLEATGQSGRGMLEFFDELRKQEVLRDRRTGSMYYDFLRTHPTSGSRITALRERVMASPYFEAEDTEAEHHNLAMIQAKIIGFTNNPNRVLLLYPSSDDSQEARYARSVAHFRNGVLERALEDIDSLIAEEPENPYFHELKGQMLFESGKAARAVDPYLESVRLAPDSALLRVGLGQAMIASNDPTLAKEAVAQLKAGLNLNPELPMAWYHLSIAYERAGERDLAQLAVAEQSYAAGDYIRARDFAMRARDGLERGGADWRRATDILAVSESLARDQAERMRRRN